MYIRFFLKCFPFLRIGKVSVSDPTHVLLIADIVRRGSVLVMDGSVFDQNEPVNIIVLPKILLVVALEHIAVIQELPIQEYLNWNAPLDGYGAV